LVFENVFLTKKYSFLGDEKHKYTIKMDAYIMYDQGVITKIKFKTQL
jgi:hypothetical protein